VAANPAPPVPAPFLYNAWVLEPWHDADTGLFRVDRGNRDYSVWSVRVLGCAARELADPGGVEARDWLRMLLPVGTPVVLTTAKPDKFGGRIDAHVWFSAVGGVADLTEVMIGAGWAARWNGTGKQPKPPWPRENR
jgi:endonuclease YncB( thermonuclease family)